MKRALIFVLAFAFAGAVAFAQKANAGKKEMAQNFKKMNELVQKYNKETDAKKKDAVKADIKKQVEQGYDKQIAFMQQRLKQSEERLAGFKKALEERQKPEAKAKRIDEITERILAPKTGKWKKGFRKGCKKGFKSFKKGGKQGFNKRGGKNRKK
ncbi:MAG: hypothetical protein LBR90_03980 [Elusimicrobiota bacterium]|jgi:hypothetical protein|nr:hypothetical protein [Elusimicrobiota bacterium]